MSRLLVSVRSYLELIRFSHTLFALPFALTGAVLAWKREGFHPVQLVGILLCMAFARSAAMAFNRLADRHLDARNPRTAGRHLPAGALRPAMVWFFLVLCCAGFVASTLIFWYGFGNPWPVILAGPVLGFLFLYSYTKRFTALAHFWLGTSLLLAPVCSWVAIRGLPGWGELAIPLLLGGAVLFWVAGFDILYACQDVDFDRKNGLRSIPAALGTAGALRVAFYCHVLMLLLLLALFLVDRQDLSWIYLAGVLAVALLVLFQHHLVRPDDLTRVNQAFFHVNTAISVGLFLVVLVQVAVGV